MTDIAWILALIAIISGVVIGRMRTIIRRKNREIADLKSKRFRVNRVTRNRWGQ